MKKTLTFAALLLAPSLAFAAPYPAGDATKGAKVFKKCASCHMVGAKAKNRVGPQLNAIIGRAIASVEGYKYSKGMVAYAAQAGAWDEANLDAYLANPRKAVKGTRMAFAGLRKDSQRQDVIAYLKQQSK
jgi:cytochrome c